MREVVQQYLGQGLSRRGFLKSMTAMGFTAAAAEAVLQPLEASERNVEGVYVYLHGQHGVREAQLQRRTEQIASASVGLSDGTLEVSDPMVIEILLTLIRHPGSDEGQVVRRLRGHRPPITARHVHGVFEQYDLDKLGEKGGSTNC